MSEVEAEQKKRASKTGPVVFLLAAAAIAVSSYVIAHRLQPSTGAPSPERVVVVDTARIMDAKISSNLDAHMKQDEFKQSGIDFASKLQSVLLDYKAHGYIVINGRAVLTSPDDADLTLEVARKLGVELKN